MLEKFRKMFKMEVSEAPVEPKYPLDNLYIALWEGYHEKLDGYDIVYDKFDCVLTRDFAFVQQDGKVKILTGENAGKVLDYVKVDDETIHAYCDGRELKISSRAKYLMYFAKTNDDESFVVLSKVKENIEIKNGAKKDDALNEAKYKVQVEKILDEEFNEAE